MSSFPFFHGNWFHTVRFAGFRLIEAGLEQEPGIESTFFPAVRFGSLQSDPGSALIHVLQLSSKAAASLSGHYMLLKRRPHIP